jgi:hypothetical protein
MQPRSSLFACRHTRSRGRRVPQAATYRAGHRAGASTVDGDSALGRPH